MDHHSGSQRQASHSGSQRQASHSGSQRQASHIGTVEQYVAALRVVVRSGGSWREMLRKHAEAEEHTLTAAELARAAGRRHHGTVNLRYGLLGRSIAAHSGLQPKSYASGKLICTSVLADETEQGCDKGHWRWKMHRDLVEALRHLDMA